MYASGAYSFVRAAFSRSIRARNPLAGISRLGSDCRILLGDKPAKSVAAGFHFLRWSHTRLFDRRTDRSLGFCLPGGLWCGYLTEEPVVFAAVSDALGRLPVGDGIGGCAGVAGGELLLLQSAQCWSDCAAVDDYRSDLSIDEQDIPARSEQYHFVSLMMIGFLE